MKKILPLIKFYWKKNKSFVGVIIVFFIISLIVVKFALIKDGVINDKFTNIWDPTLGIWSALLIVGLSFLYVKKEWEDSLENELIIHFKYKDEFIYSCYGADLLPGTDMRSLSQQIGAQMAGKFLKFNPSVQLLKQDTILVKDENNKNKWIKYYELKVELQESDQSDGSYTVWNISKDTIYKKKFKTRNEIFTELYPDFDKKKLLSTNRINAKKFNELNDDFIVKKSPKIYLTNSAFLSSKGNFEYSEIKLQDVKNKLKDDNFISAIGHQSSANILSGLLGLKIKYNRIEIIQNVGDECIVFKLKGRLEEGKVYTEDEINQIGFEFGLLKRIK